MTSLAIPSVPPQAVANVDGAKPTSKTDRRFGDALRERQAQPKATDDGHPSDPGAGSPPRKGADGHIAKQDDKASANDAPVAPGMIAAVPAVPPPVRQDAAATGKSMPAAASPAGAPTATARPQPPSPVAMQAPVVAIPGDHPPIVDAPPAHAALANKPAKVPVAGAQGANAPVAPPTGTGSTQSTAPGNDAATALGLSDPNANPPAAGQHDDRNLSNPGPDAFAAQLAQLAGVHAGTGSAQPPPAPVQLAMQSAPGQPQFAQEAAQHVSWLAGQNIQQAEIQLNPKKLGPIQVEITTHHDRVDVSFAVQHPQTVHALQQTLPQLHDMLAQQGLNLGHASVGHQSPGRQQPAFVQHAGFAGSGDRDSGSSQTDSPPAWRSLRVAVPGRVDDFA